MNIVQALRDRKLLDASIRDHESFRPWEALLAASFGIKLDAYGEELFKSCTARSAPPSAPYKSIFLCCGRRAGKSFASALIACYVSAFKDWRPFMSPGERCVILLVAGDRGS